MANTGSPRHARLSKRWLRMMLAFVVIGIMGAAAPGVSQGDGRPPWHPFSFLTDPAYSLYEQIALILNVVIALLGLGYALMLVKEVYGAETGTLRMQEIARAVREGANA